MSEGAGGSACQVVPATLEDLDWIARLEIDAYSSEHAVARRTLDEWYQSNPQGFSLLIMNGQRIGHVNILPLRPQILKSFVQGTVMEPDIHGDSLYTPREKDLIRNLYVESIIVQPLIGHSPMLIKALTCLARNFVPLIQRICDPTNLENVYAIAASGRGEHLIKLLGFDQFKSGRDRADRRDLYVARFSTLEATISGLYNRRIRNIKG